MTLLLLILTGLLACSDSGEGPIQELFDGDEDPVDTSEIPLASWHRDVSPMMQTWCTRCHMDGGQGPGDFTDYDVAAAMSEVMLAQIDAGQMPPGAGDPECRDYKGSEHLVLPAEQRQVLQDWIDADFPMGNPDNAPEVEPVETELTDPDIVLQIPEPYTPTYANADQPGNEYRCFVLEHGQTEDFYITAMAPIIDKAEIVHHIVLFAAEEDDLPTMEDPAAGFDCIDDAFVGEVTVDRLLSGNGMVGAWGPGAVPYELTEGVGLRIRPEQKLVLQMHYYLSSPDAAGIADQTSYAFETTTEAEKTAFIAPMGLFNFTIPAGDPAYSDTFSLSLPIELTLHAVFPHMHVLGTGYELTVGDECVARSDHYDFNNQLSYAFTEPVEIEADTNIEFRCTWDNSAENPNQINETPQDVSYGERTDEEMCFAFSVITFGI